MSRATRGLAAVLLALTAASAKPGAPPARPQAAPGEVVVTRPGVRCYFEDVLPRLTLPDGSSRASLPHAHLAIKWIKAEGGCEDLKIGERFTVISAGPQTTLVRSNNEAGDAATYYVPSIDVAPAGQPQKPGQQSK